MKKISLINLVDHYEENNFGVNVLGILSLATVLKYETNHDVKVIDFQNEYTLKKYNPTDDFNMEIEQLYSYIMGNNPNLIGFYTMCSNYHLSIALAKVIKERQPTTKIVFGGPQANLTAHHTIENLDWIDAIGIGEGEGTIVEIVETLLNDQDLSKVRGVVFKRSGNVIDTGMPQLIDDLDLLPMIDYSFLDMDLMKLVNLDVGRGCPFNCTFCSTKSFWKRKFRLKSGKRIVDEIKFIEGRYKIKNFSFSHDLFTANKKKLLEFCDLLINENINISWTCSSRVDTLDSEMAEKMKLAGCKSIFLGVETGSPRMQKLTNKNLNVEKIIPKVKMLKENNFELRLSFIYGIPGETREDINLTLNLINELLDKKLINYDTVQLHECTFFPGTELTELYSDSLVFNEDFNNTTMLNRAELPTELKNIIKNNKMIFPHFFNYPPENETVGLNKFIPTVYLRTQSKFRFTYKLLLDYYDNDLLKLFNAYKKYESDLLDKISYYEIDKMKGIISEVINSVKGFIDSTYYGTIDYTLKQIAKFEYDITNFLFFSKEEELYISYPLDVYKAVKNSSIDDINESITVHFSRQGEKNIKVIKVT